MCLFVLLATHCVVRTCTLRCHGQTLHTRITCSNIPQDLDQAAKLFLKAQAELATIQASLELSGLPETLDSSGSSGQAGGATAPLLKELCWDANMNNHLIPAVPPRSVKVRGA